ncbi:MAG: hypothetical protein JXR44_09615 [Thiotrichales bacterium]|nr:hypothetical protein [Thiotrichales bacterium]
MKFSLSILGAALSVGLLSGCESVKVYDPDTKKELTSLAAEGAGESKTAQGQNTVAQLFEVHQEGRIYSFYDFAEYQSFVQVGEVPFQLTRIGAGPKGETVVFGLTKADKKKGEATPAAQLWDGKAASAETFYAELRRHGRIYVFNSEADLVAVRTLGEPNFMFTEIGAGPKGETVVYVLNKSNSKQKPTALMDQFKALNPPVVSSSEGPVAMSTELFEVHHEGRIYSFYDFAEYLSFIQVGEVPFQLTRIGAGPKGETVVFGLTKADKKKGEATPAAQLWDGKLQAEGEFYGELRRHGRIYVFADKAEMEAVRTLGEPNFMFTQIGSGPNGETVVFVLNKNNSKKKPEALIAKFQARYAAK